MKPSLSPFIRLKRKWNHLLLRAGRGYNWRRVFAWPQVLQIVPSNACNLHCRNCPKTYYPTDNQHLASYVYEQVRKQLLPHISSIILQGCGEPLCSPLFPSLIEDAERFKLHVSFVTNATLLRPEMISRLVRCGAEVTVSLDGGTAETHEAARPGAHFSRIMQVFASFADERQRHPGTGFRFNINTVVNRMNAHELPMILELAGRHGASVLNLINPGVGEREDDYALAAIGHYPELLTRQLPALRRRAAELSVYLSVPPFFEDPALAPAAARPLAAAPPASRLFPQRCLDPWTMTFIDVDGSVRPCCRALWLDMGNILEDSFWAIWNNKHYRRLRAHINSNNPPAFCRNCNTSWGITGGDEHHVRKLRHRGIELPKPKKIGSRLKV